MTTTRSVEHPSPAIDDDALVLPGLDGSNPLGFLAALGLLRVLDFDARVNARPTPRLAWVDDGYWQPVLHCGYDLESVIQVVMDDKVTWSDDPALLLAYREKGDALVDPRTDARAIRDLKPSPKVMQEFLQSVARTAEREAGERREWLASRRSMDTVAAYGSEVVQARKGDTKPTAFHFTAGNQRFLNAISELQGGTTPGDLREALIGPWRRNGKLPTMRWDATMCREYALRAIAPANDERGSTPGADWLAFVGLALFVTTPRGRTLATTGVRGGWDDSSFTWPIWLQPASVNVVRSLLAMPRLAETTPADRSARGVAMVFSSAITRSDQGGYGGFSPARVE